MVRRSIEETEEDAALYAQEMTDEQLAAMRPAHEVHSAEEFAALTAVRKRGRPKAETPKMPMTIRVDAATLAAFKQTGKGWQTRVNDVLREHLVRDRNTGKIGAVRSSVFREKTTSGGTMMHRERSGGTTVTEPPRRRVK